MGISSSWSCLLCCGLVACYRPQAQLCDGECTLDGQQPDGPLPDGAICVGTSPMQFCYPAPGGASITLTSFDTDNDCPRVETRGDRTFCVVEGSRIEVAAGATIHITGSRPLALVATEQIAIEGVLDLSGANQRPAGSDLATSCGFGAPGFGVMGGGGGGFATSGASGSTSTVGTGGMAGTAATSIEFRGGCAGGRAASSNGGGGGGAVYLASASLAVNGGINAGGGGGGGAASASSAGGGGGGAGGFVALDAPISSVQGNVVATGGGGGGGTCASGVALDGNTPTLDAPNATGGAAPAGAGPGGAGAATTGAQLGGVATTSGCGGGGGGGGAGTIRVFPGSTCGGICLPATQPLP